MRRLQATFLCGLAATLLAPSLAASETRTWTDKTGKYTLEASLIAFDDDLVIVERASDKQLGAVNIEDLSQQDQEYLESKEAVEAARDVTSVLQRWTLKNGLQVNGRLVDYGRREVVLRRSRGKVYVNNRAFENLPPIYQQVVPLIVAAAGNKVEDAKALESWLASRRGVPQTFVVDGVVLELENGDEYGIPFFMFSEKDLQVLQPGWESWLAAHTAEDYEQRDDYSMQLQAQAARYHQDQVERRQIAQMQLALQAVDAGLTDVWEVTLYPAPGTAGPPLWVPVFARNSLAATEQALAQNPGYVVGPVRRVSR